jgi:hypothetical protein
MSMPVRYTIEQDSLVAPQPRRSMQRLGRPQASFNWKVIEVGSVTRDVHLQARNPHEKNPNRRDPHRAVHSY